METTIPIKITDAEWEIMRVAWANESITSREIITVLENKKQWKAATIKTLIGRLVDKGALQTIKNRNKFIYSAAVTEEESVDTYTDDILSRVCNKQSGHVIRNMIADATLSKSDIISLKRLLEQKENTALDVVPCKCVTGQCECNLHHH
ncbi:CopY/TcrY family copper transport repressor [Carnobacterium funditum]|uniref:CopY/TcrY family copper transport repressor n=1 Tax=Carnobacterium funditum TaxID=2752 RepID=UPI000558311D|nr:CopY/TcrY family copper transport repressor [Carnobacterium funditum]